METPETPRSINEVLPMVMKEIGAIAKDQRNNSQNYNFRGIDQVLNSAHGPLIKYGVTVSPTIEDYSIERNFSEPDQYGKRKFISFVTMKMSLVFTAMDGSTHKAEAIGEGIDHNGDKASAKAMSMAFKNACFMGLVIPLENEMEEGDNEPAEAITPEQVKELESLISETKSDLEGFLKWAGCDSLDKVLSSQLGPAKSLLNKKKGK